MADQEEWHQGISGVWRVCGDLPVDDYMLRPAYRQWDLRRSTKPGYLIGTYPDLDAAKAAYLMARAAGL